MAKTKQGAEEPSAWLTAENLMQKYIRDSEKIPFVCKNLMAQTITNNMTALKTAVGAIELSAHRAYAHGTKPEKQDE